METPPLTDRPARSVPRRALDHWPALFVFAVFLVGTVAKGPWSGLAAAILSFPVAGVGYLIRNARRRRRGAVTSRGGLLYRESSEALEVAVIAYLRAVSRYPILIVGMWLGLAAVIALLWLMAGRDWALGAIAWTVLAPAGIYVSARVRRSRRPSR